MITEDYVSYETAKLLKEKGFDWNTDKQFNLDKIVGDYNITDRSRHPERYLDAPTLQMAMKWLRKEHKIHIILVIHWLYFANTLGWMYTITKILENGVDYIDSKGDENDKTFYSSYEEAAEAAIKYCLKNLI